MHARYFKRVKAYAHTIWGEASNLLKLKHVLGWTHAFVGLNVASCMYMDTCVVSNLYSKTTIEMKICYNFV